MLDYLVFDRSEGDDGVVCFDAMASVPAARAPALQAEVEQVMAWARHGFGGRQAPIEEGGDWDALLQVSTAADGRVDLTLTLVGREAFAEALSQRFGLAD